MGASKLANNAVGVLAQAVGTTDTTITVAAGDGGKFPVSDVLEGEYFWATLINSSAETEIVKVRDHSSGSTTLSSVVRAQQGTTAISCAIGDRIEIRLTSEHLDEKVNTAGAIASSLAIVGGGVAVTESGANLAISDSASTPVIGLYNSTGTELATLIAYGSGADNRLEIQSADGVIDMRNMKIRNSGVETYLGEVVSTTDVATIDIIFANLGIDITLYKEIIVKLYNMGVTAAVATNMQYYFGAAGTTGTLYAGAVHRYIFTRSIYDGTTATYTGGGGWTSTSHRVAYSNDSTAHWHYTEIHLPNPARNAYSSYSANAYQHYWAIDEGTDSSSRPSNIIVCGYVNNATYIGPSYCNTGIRLSLSAAGNFRNTDIKLFGRLI